MRLSQCLLAQSEPSLYNKGNPMEKAKRWIIPLAGIGVLFLALQLGAGLSIAQKET